MATQFKPEIKYPRHGKAKKKISLNLNSTQIWLLCLMWCLACWWIANAFTIPPGGAYIDNPEHKMIFLRGMISGFGFLSAACFFFAAQGHEPIFISHQAP